MDALTERVAALERQGELLTGQLQQREHSLVRRMLPCPDGIDESSTDEGLSDPTNFDLRTAVHVVDEKHRLLKAQYVADKSLFVPFGSRGHYQPRVDGDGWKCQGGPSGPISLSRMVARGALESTPAGLETFVDLGTNLGNDRPKWPVPESEEEWAVLAEGQALFVELQGVLLEFGDARPVTL